MELHAVTDRTGWVPLTAQHELPAPAQEDKHGLSLSLQFQIVDAPILFAVATLGKGRSSLHHHHEPYDDISQQERPAI